MSDNERNQNVPLVMFSKVRRAKSADDFETWDDTGVSNTLNNFDNGDVRTNECVICQVVKGVVKNETTPKVTEGETMFTLTGSDSHRGGGMAIIVERTENDE